MSSNSFDNKTLLFVKDTEDGRNINKICVSAGMQMCDIESVDTNIVVKLQDRSYKVCMIDYNSLNKLTPLLVRNIRKNPITSQIPIIIIATGKPFEVIQDLYNSGANYVLHGDLLPEINHMAWIIESIVRYAELLKAGSRFNR